MVTAHSNKLESSTNPAEKPSTGRFVRSAVTRVDCSVRGSNREGFETL